MKVPKLLQNSAIYTIVLMLQKGISFLLLPIYTAFLSPSDYGVLGVVSSVSSLMALFITLGLPSAAQRFYFAKGRTEIASKQIFGTIASLILINSVIIGGLFLVLHRWLVDPLVGEIEFYPYVFLGIIYTCVTPLYLLFQQYLQTKQQGMHYAINAFTNFLLNVVLIVVFLSVFHLGVIGVLLANLIVAILFFIHTFITFYLKQKVMISKGISRDAFKYALPLLPHTLANWSNGTLDKLLVNGLRSKSDAGLYNMGQQYSSVMSFVVGAFNQAYVPWFFGQVEKGENGKKQIVQLADIVILVLSIIAIIFSIFSKEVLGLMISNPAYETVWKIVPFLVFAYIFHALYLFFVNVLFLKDTKFVFIITVSSVIVNIIANILLIPRYGYHGSALACIITFIFRSFMALIISRCRDKSIHFHYAKMYAISIISFMASYGLSNIPVKDDMLLLLIKIAFLILVILILYISKRNTISYYIDMFCKK